jgi:hypothetical protein
MCWNCGFGYRDVTCPDCGWRGYDDQLYGPYPDDDAIDPFPDIENPHCPKCGHAKAELDDWLFPDEVDLCRT